MKRCLLLPFDFFKPVLGTRYKPCYSILTLFLKNSQDYVVMISYFGQKSQINHQTWVSTLARMHLWTRSAKYREKDYLHFLASFQNKTFKKVFELIEVDGYKVLQIFIEIDWFQREVLYGLTAIQLIIQGMWEFYQKLIKTLSL